MPYQPYIATNNDKLRLAATRRARKSFVSIGGRFKDIDLSLYNAGEPITLPPAITTTVAIDPNATSITTTGAQTLPTSGIVVVRYSTPQAGWFTYTSRTDYTLLGVRPLYGQYTHPAGSLLSTWANITHLLSAPVVLSETESDGIITWSAELQGRGYNENLMQPDRLVLVEHQVTPFNRFPVWSARTIYALGVVRNWDVIGDYARDLRWRATIVPVDTYLDQAPLDATAYGILDLARGKSVSASPQLANPILEEDEWLGATGTTDASNITNEELGDPYISEAAPTLTPEIPWTGGPGAEVTIDEIFAGANGQSNELQFIILRLSPTSPFWETGIALNNGDEGGWFLTTRQTTFVANPHDGENGVRWSPIAVDGYLRLPAVTLTQDSPRLCLCPDRNVLEQYFSMAAIDGMQVVEWKELPGFGNDQFPARNIILRAAGDRIKLRFRRASHDEYVRDMVAWGDNSNFWEGSAAEFAISNGAWDDNNTAPAILPGFSIRRKPTCKDTNQSSDWGLEASPIPSDDRAETDVIFANIDLGQWTVLTTQAMTASSPADGESLDVDDATWLHEVGEILIGTERIWYKGRTATTLLNIFRGRNGTTAAVHAIGSNVSQINQHALVDSDGVTATVPGVGQFLPLKYAKLLPNATPDAPKTLKLENEDIKYSGRDQYGVVVFQRGANGTTPAPHIRNILARYDNGRGAHRLPLFNRVELARWARMHQRNIAPGAPFPVLLGEYTIPIRWEVWLSYEANPREPDSDPDYENDWMGQGPYFHYVERQTTEASSLHQAADWMYPVNARYVMIVGRQMSDWQNVTGHIGRWKLNLVKVPRHHLQQGDYTGDAGGPLREILLRYLPEAYVNIDPLAFIGTTANFTLPKTTVGDLKREYARRYNVVFDTQRDSKIRVYRDPYFPTSQVPAVSVVINRGMWRSDYPTNYPTRLAVGQVKVKLIDEDTDTIYTAVYPPTFRFGAVEEYEYRMTVASQGMAQDIAQGLYRRHPKIARVFEFVTTGIADWLRPGHRVIFEDVTHGTTPRPRLVDLMVTGVTHGQLPEETERVTAREMRFL